MSGRVKENKEIYAVQKCTFFFHLPTDFCLRVSSSSSSDHPRGYRTEHGFLCLPEYLTKASFALGLFPSSLLERDGKGPPKPSL